MSADSATYSADSSTYSATRDTRISKALSYLLRHGAVKEKLPIDPQGWVSLTHVLNNNRVKTHKATVQDIERIVRDNAKQRFRLKSENNQLFICANQGHTLATVTPELQLLTLETLPANIYHGTYKNKLDKIKESGLSKMNRNHIHMTSDAPWSVLGIRNNCNVLIYIDAPKCLEDGLKFWRSANGVILCEGDSSGYISPQYFRKIEPVQITEASI